MLQSVQSNGQGKSCRILVFDDNETFDYLNDFTAYGCTFAKCASFAELDRELSREGGNSDEYVLGVFDVFCDLAEDFSLLGRENIKVEPARCGPQLVGEVLPGLGFDFRQKPLILFSSHEGVGGTADVRNEENRLVAVPVYPREKIGDQIAKKMSEIGLGFGRTGDASGLAGDVFAPSEYKDIFLSLVGRLKLTEDEVRQFLGIVGQDVSVDKVFRSVTLANEKIDLLIEIVAHMDIFLRDEEFRPFLENRRRSLPLGSPKQYLLGRVVDLYSLRAELETINGGALL